MGERERVAASGEPVAPGSRRAPVRRTRLQAVLALQRAAGNAATARALGHSVLQRSIGQDIKDFLFPQPDPDPAPHLKGAEREEARERNLQSYFGRGVRSARLSFDELNDDIWSSPLTFWGDGIPQHYGMMEEIEDAFSGSALGPETRVHGRRARICPLCAVATYGRDRRPAVAVRASVGSGGDRANVGESGA